jgi:hypothetical protein
MDDRTAERLAANEATFRDANERIQERARELEFEPPVPFLCECGEPSCRAIVRVGLQAYEVVRAHATWFLVALDHEGVATAEGTVAERNDSYLVVEKTGRAGEVAADRDPRQPSARR